MDLQGWADAVGLNKLPDKEEFQASDSILRVNATRTGKWNAVAYWFEVTTAA